MSLAGRPLVRSRRRPEQARVDFDQYEERVRTRLEQLSQKRDTEHRRNVRAALADREKMRRYAEQYGATIGDGVPVPGLADGIYIFEMEGQQTTSEWRLLAGCNHFLASLSFADVTSEYTVMSEDVGARLLLVKDGRAVAYLAVLDRDLDGQPDGLLHLWVAGHQRGQGVARLLVATARKRFPIASIVGPLNEQRGAAKVAAKLAPDLPVTGGGPSEREFAEA